MDEKKRDAAVNRIAGYEGFMPRIYRDSVGVPTIGYGLSLMDPKTGKAWRDLEERLSQVGLDGRALAERVKGLIENRDQIEYASSNPFQSEPPGGIVISRDQARTGLRARVENDYDALRQKVGSALDDLNEAQTAAVMDAHYRAPGIVGEKMQGVLQHPEDPNFQDNMAFELNDVKQHTRRAADDANVFRVPPSPGMPDLSQNLLNSEQMLKSPVQYPFDARGGGNFWNEMERKLQDGMSPPARADVPVAQADAPIPENLLNMSDRELRKWGLR